MRLRMLSDSGLRMRVSVRGILVGGSCGVLLTTILLWTQCRAPQPPYPIPHHHHQHHQVHRSPLQSTSHQGGGGGEDSYMEVEYGAAIPKSQRNTQQTEGGVGAMVEADKMVAYGTSNLNDIQCIINHDSEVSCKKDENEVYIPFSFIHNYFEIYGEIEQQSDGREVFTWSHSYSNVYTPHIPYSYIYTFLNFELYNVEARDRVKCVSATEGVPISTQWQSTGYTYPIQIAQFGLSHYCKHLIEPPPERVVVEDGGSHKGVWGLEGVGARVWRATDPNTHTSILRFRTPESASKGSAVLQLSEAGKANLLVLTINVFLKGNSTLTVGVEYKDNKKAEVVRIHYTKSDVLLHVKERQIYYGLGEQSGWRHLTRNILIDLHKGAAISQALRKKFKKVSRSKISIAWLRVQGEGDVSMVALSSTEHLRHFYDAADWLIKHQDAKGGWSIPVPRKVISGVLELDAGWYSAMAQGQAMSLLIRAAHLSGQMRYFNAAMRATALFTVNSTQGGVRTYFPGGLVWYEEYPTTPSLYVLNGFIYSLLGLYDLKEYAKNITNEEGAERGTAAERGASERGIAERLFAEGMRSLKTLLPLFDTGWGSLYDLRHFSTHVAPNRARWDYHTTHITQLLLLASLDSDPVISSTAERWKEYMNGKRAKHN